MHRSLQSPRSDNVALVRAGFRTPVPFTHIWTGRARVSMTTDTLVPRCVATTTHRTRVSEMRLLGRPRRSRVFVYTDR